MEEYKTNDIAKWAIILIVSISPTLLYFYLIVFLEKNLFISYGEVLGLSILAWHELFLFFFDYEKRFETSWLLFHTNTRDYIVSITAILSLFIISILNQWIMQKFDMNIFILGGLINILIPVCITWFAGSKVLRKKIFRRG